MKCQNLLSGRNKEKKNISKCCLLIFLPSMQNVDRKLTNAAVYWHVCTQGMSNQMNKTRKCIKGERNYNIFKTVLTGIRKCV